MEFFDEYFTETTPQNKTEQKYDSIERISVIQGKTIYIHVNNVMSYLLPVSCFDSKEQYDAFNAQYMKIAVGKGDVTFDEILRMIEEYLVEADVNWTKLQ